MENFEGRVAVVTGGASGIGKAMARAFAAEGMHVVIADVEAAALDATAKELDVVAHRLDVSQADEVAALAEAVMAQFGRVDIVANNAGVGGGGFISDLTLKDWQWVLGVNLWGVIHGIQSFLPHLLANPDGGHLVNTASIAGLIAGPYIGPYNASKYAVVAISETLSKELAMTGSSTKVSVLCPGYVRTNIFDSQRNRPAELSDGKGPNRDALANNDDIKAAAAALAIEPDQVAADVLAAVREERFWIFTHPEMMGMVADRNNEINAAVAQATR
jgi:NAD(P)-dependent dehydrogenase (short-subunit alcohol dehydrogenase family)